MRQQSRRTLLHIIRDSSKGCPSAVRSRSSVGRRHGSKECGEVRAPAPVVLANAPVVPPRVSGTSGERYMLHLRS